MAKTRKSGKGGSRRRPLKKPRSTNQGELMGQRRSYGRTEKILRRNRKLWVRLVAKEGRKLDKAAVKESEEGS